MDQPTHPQLGPRVVKLRSTRSAVGVAAGSLVVVLNPRRRETPWIPACCMSLSDTLPAHTDALLAQVMQNAGSVVGLVGGLVSGLDLGRQPLVGEFSIRRRTDEPRASTRWRRRPALGTQWSRDIGPVRVSRTRRSRWQLLGLLRQTRPRLLRGSPARSYSWRFSRLRRISSSFSAVVRPSERSPWSRSA